MAIFTRRSAAPSRYSVRSAPGWRQRTLRIDVFDTRAPGLDNERERESLILIDRADEHVWAAIVCRGLMRRSWPAAAILALVLVCMVAAMAAANNWGSSVNTGGTAAHACDTSVYSQCRANNQYHDVWINSSNDDLMEEIQWSMLNYNAVAPPMSMAQFAPPSPYYAVDVEVRAASYPTTMSLAWTACKGPASDPLMQYGGTEANHDRWCRPQILRFNTYYMASHFPTDAKQRYLACHELGHTVGLRHTNESSGTCMLRSTITPNTPHGYDDEQP